MFMKQQITDKQRWAEVESDCGTEWVPIEQLGIALPDTDQMEVYRKLLRDYLEGNWVFSVEERVGYGARLSAPGYLDCTDWGVFDTEQEAKEYLEETYGDEDA